LQKNLSSFGAGTVNLALKGLKIINFNENYAIETNLFLIFAPLNFNQNEGIPC
jgi:hypothetical protein